MKQNEAETQTWQYHACLGELLFVVHLSSKILLTALALANHLLSS